MPLNFDPNELVPGSTHRTLAERAYDVLHQAIVTGLLAAGERLPIEELARNLEMSPMPIREALRRLDSVGLVENTPHRGARVTELSVGDLREICDARLALEPLAIRHAAETFSDEAAATARAALEVYRTALRERDEVTALAAHTRFHFILYKQADSGWLNRLIRPLWDSSERYRLVVPMARVERRFGEHKRILAACIAHEPDVAAAELFNHLATTANAVAKEMGEGDNLIELVPVPGQSKRPTKARSAGKGRRAVALAD